MNEAARQSFRTGASLTGFFRQLAQYYSEFLSTDFKKQRLPRRRLETSDAKGRLTGIPLRKYPGFQQKLWELLGNKISDGLEFSVSRGTWRANLPKTITDAINAHIAEIGQLELDKIVADLTAHARGLAGRKKEDPEIAFEQFCERVRTSLAQTIILPLLDRMEGFFARTEYKPVESLKEFEDQISALLANGIESTSGAAFSTLLVNGNVDALAALLRDQMSTELVRSNIREFFASFASGDLYVDLSDLTRSSRLIENVEFYLHIGEVHHAGNVYPIFYMPLTAERTERTFKISSDPHLYVNKRAMDYVAQEVARSENRPLAPSVIRDRILYLSPHQSVVDVAQTLLDNMAGGFNIRAEIDLRQPRDQKVSSVAVTLTNHLSISLFDRADESMVNDYETLLTGIEAGDDVTTFFKDLIDDFLLENPTAIRSDIEREWQRLSMPQRLVFDSPLPLVEEQRKILAALQHDKSQFIAVEGPPGTGKSHTITAVAFQTIMSGKSLLVLSDKKEALDVVEDKLDQALAKVRPSADFPNPILRLGKGQSNYARLMRRTTLDKLLKNQQIANRRKSEREKSLDAERKKLITDLETTATIYSSIDVAEIADFEKETTDLFGGHPALRTIMSDSHFCEIIDDFGHLADFVRLNSKLSIILRWQGARPSRLNQLNRIATGLATIPAELTHIDSLVSFSLTQLNTLAAAIGEIEDAANPIFGYLFANKKLRRISKLLREECKIETAHPNADLKELKVLHAKLQRIQQHLAANGLDSEFQTAIVLIAAGFAGPHAPPLAPAKVLQAANRLDKNISAPFFSRAPNQFYPALLEELGGPFGLIYRLADFRSRQFHIATQFSKIPEIDYLKAKTNIEKLNTEILADQIDDRLIDFSENKRNTAMALAKIIREKQRFPVDKFPEIQRAFPCVIASLRDYADYIPLHRNIFDLVIIDEASQVSIAQALPAIIRARKLLVLGDRNQFGNVKTSNASQQVNAAYMQEVAQAFSNDFPHADITARIKVDLFDIRSSVLDFIEPISNFSIQLKKHFRSYPEMISFSSKYFYGDSLQIMKIRGKPIGDVIEFDPIEHDGLLDKRNVNEPEAKRIIERIVDLLDLDFAPTVGVITPHTEQQAFISNLAHDHPRSDELYDKLRLKVMTFDTCQGEEREIIFYSLVATKEKDRLAYVFPRHLDGDHSEEIDHNLRLQRLNVGLSRGQEKIIFVHSKPLNEYASALKIALNHYFDEIDRAKRMPTSDDVDASSPMERSVLHWLTQVPLVRELGKRCEIIAQFELGKYLRQLDPTYQHPNYRVDFLLRVADGHRVHQLVLEYDGFEFHFEKGVPRSIINDSTWRTYLTADDLEREKVLESFGVKMIRLNKFILGTNPVATIDALLRKRLNGIVDSVTQ